MEGKNAKVLDDSKQLKHGMKRKYASFDADNFSGVVQPVPLHTRTGYRLFTQACSLSAWGQRSSKIVAKNYDNFVKSGVPKTMLFCENGKWREHPSELVGLIQKDFQAKKAITEVVIRGNRLLLDFVHMIQIDTETEMEQPLAWIDDQDSRFFPEFSHDPCGSLVDHSNKTNLDVFQSLESKYSPEIKIEMNFPTSPARSSTLEQPLDTYRLKRVKVEERSNQLKWLPVEYSENEEKVGENELCTMLPLEDVSVDHFHGKLTKLVGGGKAYDTVEKLLLYDMGQHIDRSKIVGIYNVPPASPFGQMRLKLFHKHAEDITKIRGNANIRYAWMPSSKEASEQVMFWGATKARMFMHGKSGYGNSLLLNPGNRSSLSARCSEVDENGIVHLVLCRVVLGSLEKINPGSKQSQPSNGSFDSGVDNFENPNHYIIWEAHADSHILPEYVVSFRFRPNAEEHLQLQREQMSDITSLTCDDISSNPAELQTPVPDLDSKAGKVLAPLGNHLEHARLISRRAKLPTSPWMPFSMLFAAISTEVTEKVMEKVNAHYEEFKRKQISRIDLIKKLRLIIGDELLISTILLLQHKVPPRGSGGSV